MGMLLADAAPVVWEATPKQFEFLACPDYEVLYGGAAGGGKSDALLIDLWSLQYGGPQHPKHRAICFRRSFPELQDLIDRSHELFPAFIRGIKYNKVEHVWTTPAGAKFEFGYLNNDKDRFKYRGRAWNQIGFDELTLWPTKTCYEYLSTRNRTTARDLPKNMRATTNPDGVGQKWVMERWGIQPDGGASRILIPIMHELEDGTFEKRTIARTFIPAKLSDNPHLRGTGYREILMQTDKETQDAQLHGLWKGNKVEGAYYFKELQAARAEGRIGRVPHLVGVPVNVFWDIGWNDFMSLWFHQSTGLENRFIHAFQNSGETFAYYAAYFQELQQKRGYVFGTHYLPHDAANKNPQTGKSSLQILYELLPGHKFQVVPRIERLLTGVQQTRAALSSCYFDEAECADGLASLGAYRKKWNNAIGAYTDEAVHDEHSNFADSFRQFGQGFDGARIHIHAAEPKWKKKLRGLNRGPRDPMTS